MRVTRKMKNGVYIHYNWGDEFKVGCGIVIFILICLVGLCK